MFLHHRAATVQEAASCTKHSFSCFREALLWVSVCGFFFKLHNKLSDFHIYRFLFCFLKVLAGMNVHPAEFDGLKQEYNVKGYPTFCYFEWVNSSHPSHFRLSPRFQSSEHQESDHFKHTSPVRDSWSTTRWWQTRNLQRRPSRFRVAR